MFLKKRRKKCSGVAWGIRYKFIKCNSCQNARKMQDFGHVISLAIFVFCRKSKRGAVIHWFVTVVASWFIVVGLDLRYIEKSDHISTGNIAYHDRYCGSDSDLLGHANGWDSIWDLGLEIVERRLSRTVL